jgi:hypothetical protein
MQGQRRTIPAFRYGGVLWDLDLVSCSVWASGLFGFGSALETRSRTPPSTAGRTGFLAAPAVPPVQTGRPARPRGLSRTGRSCGQTRHPIAGAAGGYNPNGPAHLVGELTAPDGLAGACSTGGATGRAGPPGRSRGQTAPRPPGDRPGGRGRGGLARCGSADPYPLHDGRKQTPVGAAGGLAHELLDFLT